MEGRSKVRCELRGKSDCVCIMNLQRRGPLLITRVLLSRLQVLDVLPLHIRAAVEAQMSAW